MSFVCKNAIDYFPGNAGRFCISFYIHFGIPDCLCICVFFDISFELMVTYYWFPHEVVT